MPSFPIIDTHLHIWDITRLNYPWLDSVPMLKRNFSLSDYDAATMGIGIDKMVFVQCECTVEQCRLEVEWVSQLASREKRLKGIVGWAPIELGVEAKTTLDAYKKNSLVKGIRRIIQFEDDPEFCLRTAFVEGVQLLADYGFTFDICVAHHQLPKIISLVEKCPSTMFVLDHGGKPDIKNQLVHPWKEHISILAQLPNVHCKLSGFLTEADHDVWKQSDLEEYVRIIVEQFTADRIMFGGDWPVLTQAGSFTNWIEVLDDMLRALPDGSGEKIFRSNAEEFYRLN